MAGLGHHRPGRYQGFLEALESSGVDVQVAIQSMRGRDGCYDPALLAALASIRGTGDQNDSRAVRELTVAQLRRGMLIVDPVRTKSGVVVVSRGHEVTESLMARLRNFAQGVGVVEPIRVTVPASASRTG